jgi:hypothetical protein
VSCPKKTPAILNVKAAPGQFGGLKMQLVFSAKAPETYPDERSEEEYPARYKRRGPSVRKALSTRSWSTDARLLYADQLNIGDLPAVIRNRTVRRELEP